ncbi:MAG TPA: DUF485 domain-containing protein [Polyangia bacterium]|nr:DUF485 domain-containing protein [Polyangia bacterium]
MTEQQKQALEALSSRRWLVAALLTGAMVAAYFGFILLVAFGKPLMGRLLGEGLSLGILLGAIVIVLAPTLTGIYVYWANRHYDSELRSILGPKGQP